MQFRTAVELGGKTATGLRVPAEVVAGLGRGKRPPVRVTVGGHTYRSTVAPMGDAFFLPLSAANRHAAGVAAGDEVEVSLELDTEPRTVEVPEDLAAALTADPAARQVYDQLSNSHQREHVNSVTSAKRPETRARRVEAAIRRMREGR